MAGGASSGGSHGQWLADCDSDLTVGATSLAVPWCRGGLFYHVLRHLTGQGGHALPSLGGIVENIYVQPIKADQLPNGSARHRLRFTPTSQHADDDIDALVAALRSVWGPCDGLTAAA
jgi:hypothetical protein